MGKLKRKTNPTTILVIKYNNENDEIARIPYPMHEYTLQSVLRELDVEKYNVDILTHCRFIRGSYKPCTIDAKYIYYKDGIGWTYDGKNSICI